MVRLTKSQASALFPYASPSEDASPSPYGDLFPPPPPFTPHDVTHNAFSTALTGAGLGLFASAYRNATGKHNHGALGIFTRSGATIGWLAAVGPAYVITSQTAANIRETNDVWNAVGGGAAAGFLIGARSGKAGNAAAFAAGLAVLAGLIELSQGDRELFKGDSLSELELIKLRSSNYWVRKKWEDISPPPGEGYGPYPGRGGINYASKDYVPTVLSA